MILAGQLLLEDSPGRCRISPGYVRIDGDVIGDVVEGPIPATADRGGRETLIAPGFIDTHLHLPQFDSIGAHGLPLLRWLSEVIYSAEMGWADVDRAKAMTSRVVAQLLSVGTTAFCGYATVHFESARAAIEVAGEAGMRGVIGQVLMDRAAPDPLCRPASQLLDEAERLAVEFPADRRMAAAVTPRFAVACTPALLAGAGRIAADHGCFVQSHLAETVKECEWVGELFPGQSYVDVYASSGLLGPKSILGHGVHLQQRDRRELASSGAIIAHCPTANSFLRSGTMNRALLAQDDVSLTLGSDIGAGYERSMVRVARAMIESASALGESFPSVATAWHSITAGNADRLGWTDAGRLAIGSPADLLVVRPSVPWLESDVDPLSLLMFAWDDRWIERTMLRGRWAWSAPSSR